MRFLNVFRSLLFFSLVFCPFLAQSEEEGPPVSIELISESTSFNTSDPQWIGIHFHIDKPWYTYWKNPGDSGFPISVEWSLPSGFSVSELLWPAPEKEVSPAGVVYTHSGDFWLLARLIPEKGAILDSTSAISAEIQSLICSDEHCHPFQKTVSLTPSDQRNHSDFEHARSLLPKEWKRIQVKRDLGLIEMIVPGMEEANSAYFYPDQKDIIDGLQEPILFHSDQGVHILVKESEKVANYSSLEGTLVIEKKGEKIPLKVSSSVTPGLSEVVNPKAKSTDFQGGVLMALALAFLGGLILNLMPCVLPVISLKIFSFVKMAGKKRSQTLLHGAMFAAGVLFSFWVLAALLLMLQAYGHAVGWGFQLQEPIFVAALAAIILMFSLSLFGVFEFGTGVASWAGQTEAKSKDSRLFGSFFSGILATAVATPCTGPFLGSAIGFAVTLSPFYALSIFTSLALGMAFPYILISAFPQLVRFLPKPGPWMIVFKEVLGFIMLATTLWLMWVFAAQTGTMALFILMGGLLSFAFGCWIYGKWGTPIRKKRTRLFAYTGSSIFCILGVWAVIVSSSFEPEYSFASEKVRIAENEIALADGSENGFAYAPWEPYSESKLAELRSQGIPVLIDFTARWCLICQVNHMSLSTPEVEKKIQEKKVVKMIADWTRHDPQITRALGKYGRNGVPLYLLFASNREPEILPQVLTPDIVLQSLNKIP